MTQPALIVVVSPIEAGLRLDQALAALTPLSRRAARRLVSEGCVWRDGRPTRNQSRPVEMGTVLELRGEEAREVLEEGSWEPPETPEVRIVYEDESLVAVDKPFGVLSQPADVREEGELAMDELVMMALAVREGRRPFLRLVHRLDRLTSGLLLFARAENALEPLARAWREGRVARQYLAIVEGVVATENQTVDAPIARVPDGGWRFEVPEPFAHDQGKPAQTEVRLLASEASSASGTSLSLVECWLITGRTHQVRVHLAHLGHPVSGDRLYGAQGNAQGRPLLHAASLSLPHPASDDELHIESPPPQEFVDLFAEAAGTDPPYNTVLTTPSR